MAAPQKYAHIDFTPPAGARKEAEQGLTLRREHGRGGTAVGIARARDISNGVELSPSTVRRMKAFFDRHASDSKAEGFRRGEKGWPSNGVIANKLWGGPAGYTWAKKVVAQMNKADEEDRSTYSLDVETSTIESGTDRRSSVVPNIERRFIGNFSDSEEANPDLLKVEERADPNTGKKQTYLVGYAATFGKNSLLLGDFVERIAPTAFEIVEKRKDADGKPLETRCLFNHSPDQLLGRFPTTMKMWVDERGLRYECLLPESRADLRELVARGDLKGSSFSFVVAEGGERWSTEEGRSIRLVTKIKSLLDCGPVTYPAYDSATVAVAKRSYDQFIAGKAPAPVAEKRDSGIAARAAEEARKTQEFLAERRGFCATGPGGGIDNSCGKGESGGSEKGGKDDVKKMAKDAADKYNAKGGPSAAAKGAMYGAIAGSAYGIPGAIGGALAGGLIGAVASALKSVSASAMKAKMDGLKEKMKLSDVSLAEASGKVFSSSEKTSTAAIDKKTIAIEQGDSIALISDGSPFSKDSKGTSFHYQPGADKDGKFDLKAVEGAARAVNAKSVSVEAWHDDDVKALESKGYRQVAKSGYSSSKGIYEKSLKGSKRDIDELQSFLAERRGFCPTGPGGGVDNSCGREGGGGSKGPDMEKAKKAKEGYDKWAKTSTGKLTLGTAAGAIYGATVGAIGGPVGAAAGAAIGAGVGAAKAFFSKDDSKVAESLGVSEKSVASVVGAIGKEASVSVHKDSVVIKAKDGTTMTIKKDQNSKGVVASVSPPDEGLGKTTKEISDFVEKYVDAAKKSGVDGVRFQLGGSSAARGKEYWDPKDKKAASVLEKNGFMGLQDHIPKGMLSKSKITPTYYTKYFKSKRSIDELQSFLAERRAFCPTGPGGGVKNDCGSKDGGNSVEPKPGPNPNDTPKTLEQQRIEAAGKSGFVTAPKASDKPKSLEQQRLESAGEWDDRIDPPALADYDGGDNGGFVPDYYKDVTIPGTSQKVKINVDDPEHVKQFIELSAKASGVSVEEFMKVNRFGGTLQKVTEHDKVKLFGGDWKKYRTKLARSGGWGNKELDETAKRIGSTLRAGRIKGETLAHAVREYAKETGKDPKDEMYSGMKTYQRDPREFMQWARKRLDHYFASGKGKWGYRSTDACDSAESRIEALSEFLHSRGFCPTGPGGGIDNSCGGGKDKGPDLLGRDIEKTVEKIKESGGKVDGPITGKSSSGKEPLSSKALKTLGEMIYKAKGSDGPITGKSTRDPMTFQVMKDLGDLVSKARGDYLEWDKSKDHKDPDKAKKAQDFLDKARTDQLARGGKDGGKSDDGGGVQTWSKGDHFPWTAKQVGTEEGFVQGQHPDGSKTAKYPFKGDSSEAHKKVYDEIKSKKKDKRSVTLAEMKSFFMERAG